MAFSRLSEKVCCMKLVPRTNVGQDGILRADWQSAQTGPAN
jgi:hypothetical protein